MNCFIIYFKIYVYVCVVQRFSCKSRGSKQFKLELITKPNRISIYTHATTPMLRRFFQNPPGVSTMYALTHEKKKYYKRIN